MTNERVFQVLETPEIQEEYYEQLDTKTSKNLDGVFKENVKILEKCNLFKLTKKK